MTHLNNNRTNSAVQTGVPNPGWGTRSSDRLGYDGAGRLITKRYLDGGIDDTGESPTYAYNDPTAIVGFTTAFDDASNKTYERHLHSDSTGNPPMPERRSHRYTWHDSMNRLRGYERGALASGGGSVADPISLPGTDADRTYALDGLGNWQESVYTPVGGSETTDDRTHNYLNQVTEFDDGTDVLYDHGDNTGAEADRGNGNVVDDGTREYAYDALNRLKTVTRKSDDETIATYTYDALGRRIRKEVTNGGLPGDLPNGTTDYLYAGVRCVEERNPFGGEEDEDTPLRQYV
jgi:YD repeat-containing protein